MQEFLNRSDDHLWGIVSNGLLLRVLRDNASLTRAAYCEFDLEGIFDGESYSDFVLLWLIGHRTRFEGDPPEKCVLEQWSAEAASAGTRALDRLREGVEKAIISLGKGFLAQRSNSGLRARLHSGELTDPDYLRQLLRLAYRLIFLLVAEARDLLLDPHADETARIRYREFYSVERLRKLSARRRGTPHDDLWRSLQVTMAALDADHPGIPALGLVPRGSFLWSPDSTPDLADASIDNRHLLEAMRRLSLVRDVEAKVYRPVDYRNLGTRELGSVYESLLELHPKANVDARTFELESAAGAERKLTGSYYTPESLISRLLDEALDPVLDEAEGSPDPEQALLDLRVLDPACGSGHFLISAAHRIAGRLASVRVGGIEPAPDELREALRDVVGGCLYGIDINPMAVELCKVSLWLEANDNRRPLGFLDHHIACGNSLLGTTPELLEKGVPNEAFKALTGDDKKWVTQLRKTNRAERKQRAQELLALDWSPADDISALADDLAVINTGTEETVADVASKSELFADLQQSPDFMRTKLAADAWCAAFVALKRPGEPVITDSTVRAIGVGLDVGFSVKARIEQLKPVEYRFIHPHVVFPDVFDHGGGFDVVLGNPPWDKVEFKEKEFFAVRDPDIASLAGAVRKRAIAQLSEGNPPLYVKYVLAKRVDEGARALLASSGAYPLCGTGRINTYAVFAEWMRNAVSRTGRVGVIVPTGVATDNTTKEFFSELVVGRSIISLYDFEDPKPFFPEVSSQRFCLLIFGGKASDVAEPTFVFFATELVDLDYAHKRFTLAPEDFMLLNPNTRTTPTFRSHYDAELTKNVYRHIPILVREHVPSDNPWQVTLRQGLFNMTTASHLFRGASQLANQCWQLRGNHFIRGGDQYLPLYEAKMVHQYDHRWATYESGRFRDVTDSEKRDPTFFSQPRYWVPASEVADRIGTRPYLLAWRGMARSTDQWTLFSALHPPAGVGNSLSLFIAPPEGLRSATAVLAIMNSFVCNFITRQKLSGANLNIFIIKQLPIIEPARVDRHFTFIEDRVLELSYTAWDLAQFGALAGYHGPPFRWNEERRFILRAELDALIFRLYAIARSDVDYILDTFAILHKREMKRWGEYRTKRLILDRYDAMARSDTAGFPYQTIIDPPPAHPLVAHDESTRPYWALAMTESSDVRHADK